MNVNDLKSSKFLTKYDVEPPVLVTIKSYEEKNVAMESQAPEKKWTLMFEELEKPLVLNSTNGQLIAAIVGSDEADEWVGKKVVLYNDKTVSYAGKITGGIRIRAAKVASQDSDSEPNPSIPQGRPNPDYVSDGPPPPKEDDIDFQYAN